MMSRSCGVGQNLKAQENWGGDNHTRDLISETGMMESLHAISSCVLIAADAASQCQTRTKTLCKLLLPAAVQVSTSGQACSQDKKMYSKKKKCCLHKHILYMWNTSTGMHSWTPADIWWWS